MGARNRTFRIVPFAPASRSIAEIMKLTRALLFVKELDRMAAFYRDTVGLRPVAETQTRDWIEFETGGARLALHATPAAIADGIEILQPPRPRESTPIKLIFEVEDLSAERARLEAKGVPLRAHPWGACDATDPEGNIFQFRPQS
jgi:catechol-2,3-dioxygenase